MINGHSYIQAFRRGLVYKSGKGFSTLFVSSFEVQTPNTHLVGVVADIDQWRLYGGGFFSHLFIIYNLVIIITLLSIIIWEKSKNLT